MGLVPSVPMECCGLPAAALSLFVTVFIFDCTDFGEKIPAEDFNYTRCSTLMPVNGSWSQWSNYSQCTVTCGCGLQTRKRMCNNPAPAYGGNKCIGDYIEAKLCNEDSCPIPIHGSWSDWQSSGCSVTCGYGFELKNRTCDNPAPAYGGKPCDGYNIDATLCNIQSCDVPVNGNWSDWQISGCSVTCGYGIKSKTRTCDNPAPKCGGKHCIGNNFEGELCRKPGCVYPCEKAGGVCMSKKKRCYGEILANNKCKNYHAKCCKKTSSWIGKKYYRRRG